jgi:hypothetical protein
LLGYVLLGGLKVAFSSNFGIWVFSEEQQEVLEKAKEPGTDACAR